MTRKQILLIAEDDEPMRKMLATALENAGYAVEQVSNGREGLAMVQVTDYDGLLVDVMMPLVDGLEMVREIRSRDLKRVPRVIMMSSLNHVPLREQAKDLGVEEIVDKGSLSVEEIVGKVNEVMGK